MGVFFCFIFCVGVVVRKINNRHFFSSSSSSVLQEDVCHIGGACFADGFVNPNNAEEVCRPLISTTAWTLIRGGYIIKNTLL